MGEVTNPSGRLDGENESVIGREKRAYKKRSNTNSSTSTSTNESGGSNETNSEKVDIRHTNEREIIPQPLEIPVEIPQIETKGKRGRKPKSETTSVVNTAETSENLQLLLITLFDFLAMKTSDVWKLSPSEAKQLCDPLSRILARFTNTEVVNKNMDYVMLLTALSVIILPRLLLYKAMKKEEKPKKAEVIQNAGNNERATTTNSRPNNNNATDTNPNGFKDILTPLV